MVLGTSELQKLIHTFTCINENNIRSSSIDLSLSETAKIRNDQDINLFESYDDSSLETIYETINLAKGYQLKPLTYMYASTCEKVSIPENMCGIIFPRSSFARIGLIMPLSFYANPGYEGHLPIIIFNASSSNITIPPYIRIAQLLLLEVKGNAIPYNKLKDSKYHNETKLSTPKFTDNEIRDILAKLQ